MSLALTALPRSRAGKKKAAVPPHNSIAIVVPPPAPSSLLSSSGGRAENGAVVVAPRQAEAEEKKEEEEEENTNTILDAYPKDSCSHRVLQPSWLVQTPYGPGEVQACRLLPDNVDEEKEEESDDHQSDDNGLLISSSGKHSQPPRYKYYIRLESGDGEEEATKRTSPPRRLVTHDNHYPSIEPQIGSEVVLTCFRHTDKLQRGRVVQLRPQQRQAVVRLVSWRLLHHTSGSGGSNQSEAQQQQHPRVAFVTCYLNYQSLQVVASKPLHAMTSYETLLYVHERQQLAYEQYIARQYGPALHLYTAAVDALQSLLVPPRGSPNNTNDDSTSLVKSVRGNLILTQIRCGTQAAVAAWHLRNFQGVIGHSMTSLKLLRALEKKKEESILREGGGCGGGGGASATVVESVSDAPEAADQPSECGTEQQRRHRHHHHHHERRVGEMRVFGVWRIKAMQLLALALMQFRQWDHARDIVVQAHKVVLKYAHADGGAPPPSSSSSSSNGGGQKSTFREFLRRKAQLLRVDKSLLRLYAKIEQRRRTAYRKNLEDRSITIEQCPSGDATNTDDNVSDLDDADWLDEDEERDMAADWQPMAAMVVGELDGVPVAPPPPPRLESVATIGTTESCCSADDATAPALVSSSQSIDTQEEREEKCRVAPKVASASGPAHVVISEYSSPPPPTVAMSNEPITKLNDCSSASTTEHPIVTDSDDDSIVEEEEESYAACGAEADDSPFSDGGDPRRECEASSRIQSIFRGVLARRDVLQRRASLDTAVTSIQAWYRASQQRIHFQSFVAAAILLQALVRGFVSRKQVRKIHDASNHAAVHIQSSYRRFVATTEYRRRQKAAILLHSTLRGFLVFRQVKTFQFQANRAASRIQADQRMRIARRQYVHKKQASHAAATKLQALHRRRERVQHYALLKHSAVRIQATARALNAKKALKSRREAAALIQSKVRAHQVQRKIEARSRMERDAATKIQALQRGKLLHSQYLCQRLAVVKFQAVFRGSVLARSHSQTRRLVTVIQALTRAKLVRLSTRRRLQASVTIQALSRGFLTRRRVCNDTLVATAAARKIQARYRGMLARRSVAAWKQSTASSAIKIQACFRGHLHARTYLRMVQAATRIQSASRAVRTKSLARSRLRASVLLQSFVRMLLTRRNFRKYKFLTIAAATKLQAFHRRNAARRRYSNDRNDAFRAAETIQSWYKGRTQARSYALKLASLVLIQSFARATRARMGKNLKIQAATRIQTAYRGFRSRRELCTLRNKSVAAATKIQATHRSKSVQKAYVLVRDEYRRASTRIQAMVRCHAERVWYSRTLGAAIKIQAVARRDGQRKVYLSVLMAVCVLQRSARAFLLRARVRKMKVILNDAATRIQASERGRVARLRCTRARDSRHAAATELQSFFRIRVQVQKYAEIKRSVLKIQSVVRLLINRRDYLAAMESLVLIQGRMRGYKARRDYELFRSRATKAALRLQSVQRGRAVRKISTIERDVARSAATAIQTRFRGYLQHQSYIYMMDCILRIQSMWRMRRDKTCASLRRKSVLLVQSRARTFVACRRFGKFSAQANRSALRIQAMWRGRTLRTSLQAQRKASKPSSKSTASYLGDVDETKISRGTYQTESNIAGIESSCKEATRSVLSGVVEWRSTTMLAESRHNLIQTQDADCNGTVASEEASNATSPFFDTASQASVTSDVPSLNSGRFSVVSAPAYLLSKASRSTKAKAPVVRKAFVDPATLSNLKKQNRPERGIDGSKNALTAPAILESDDTSVISEAASQITAASAYFDAASQQSGYSATSDIASVNSGYSRFSVVSAPAFVRSEVGQVRDRNGNLTSARKVFVDTATLKKLQKRSHAKPSSGSKLKRKPFIAPHLMDELTEASVNSVQSSPFAPVYEEPPDDQWREEIKVFAPKAKKTISHKAVSPKLEGVAAMTSRTPKASEIEIDVDSGSRRVSFAQDVVFAENFTDHATGTIESSEETEVRPRRRAWFQTREFRAGVGTIVAGGASIGTMLAAKLMSKGR